MALPTGLDFPTDWARHDRTVAVRDAVIRSALCPLVRFLSTLEVRGAEQLVSGRTYIFTSNHVSHLDTPIVLSALPAEIRRRLVVAGAMDTFFMKPSTAVPIVAAFNVIPIERHKVNRRSADLAQRLLSEGWHLLIYPEGGRTTTGTLMEFKGGAAYLSERTGAYVVPTYIHGAGELMGPTYAKADVFTTAKSQWRHHVSITFGEPTLEAEGENMRRFGARIEESVAQLGRTVSGDATYGVRSAL